MHDPVVGPIYQTSLFTFKDFAAMQRSFAGEGDGYIYSRVGNPTVHDFELRIAALEGAEAARGFASGMAAISATVLSIVKTGERIVAVPLARRLSRRRCRGRVCFISKARHQWFSSCRK
jgi:O-acetylhomoserine/O-acetylserine sulfhydrylase-like pyridoxal-dependent enzyme